GAGEQRGWYGEAERLRGLKVDDQLEFRGLQYWQICWPGALENFAGVDANLAGYIRDACTVAHQAAGERTLARKLDCRQCVASCQGNELLAPGYEERV